MRNPPHIITICLCYDQGPRIPEELPSPPIQIFLAVKALMGRAFSGCPQLLKYIGEGLLHSGTSPLELNVLLHLVAVFRKICHTNLSRCTFGNICKLIPLLHCIVLLFHQALKKNVFLRTLRI